MELQYVVGRNPVLEVPKPIEVENICFKRHLQGS